VLHSGIKRREFVIAGIAATAALGLPKSAKAQTTCDTTSPRSGPINPYLNPPSDTTFPQPKCCSSVGGTVSVNWVVNSGQVCLGSYTGQNIRFLAESGSASTPLIPGPTLVVNPGDLIEINLDNQLQPYDIGDQSCPPPIEKKTFSLSKQKSYPIFQMSRGELHNKPNCFNTTNLHFHGLHLSPLSKYTDGTVGSGRGASHNDVEFSSDDVLFELEPQTSHKYCVQLPEHHAPGTHWYHPHRHGSTALHVSSGMAGVIIIKDPVEIFPVDSDVLWILQDIVANNNMINDDDIYHQQGTQNSEECLVKRSTSANSHSAEW